LKKTNVDEDSPTVPMAAISPRAREIKSTFEYAGIRRMPYSSRAGPQSECCLLV
jgi:hypothetical protein